MDKWTLKQRLPELNVNEPKKFILTESKHQSWSLSANIQQGADKLEAAKLEMKLKKRIE